MGYDVYEFDKTPSDVGVFWCSNLPVWFIIIFACCVEKGSKIRRVQYARCDVGKLSYDLLCSIGRCCLLCGCERTDTNDTEV